jgi:DNA replication protein DnaC
MLRGDSGTGKSHLLVALGLLVCEAGRHLRSVASAGLVNELVEPEDE